MSGRTMIAVDPGIDLVAVAVFRWEKTPGTAVEVVAGFQQCETLKTSPDTALPLRLERITTFMADVIQRHTAFWLAVEMPPVWHAKLQKGRIPPANLLKSVAKLNMATGAIWAARAIIERPFVRPIEVEAPTQSKVERHASLERLMKVNGWRPLTNEDQRDAVWTGVIAAGSIDK